jgi:nucleoside-diphosphate-sugar epimerase
MRYLVTGGAGFIGSNLVDEVLRRGHQVAVLDDLSTGREGNLAHVRDKIEFHKGSITDLNAVQVAVRGADYVVHLAARVSVPRSIEDPIDSNRVNIDGTLNVLVAARDAKVRRMVFAASSAAYGDTDVMPKVETLPADPISPYGITKYVGELYAKVFGKVYGLENACVRYFNVFGPRQDPSSQYSGVLSRFMLAAVKGEPVTIFGDGEQSRDFTFVENVIDETLRACDAKGASGLVFNGGTGVRITLNEVVEVLSKITGRKIEAKYEAPRKGDILHSQADISLARDVLGYEPKVSFEEGLKRTWEWYSGTYRK